MPTLARNIVETSRGTVSYSETGSGPVHLVLHSLLTDRNAFDRVTGPLGGRFIAMDLPGFGATDIVRPGHRRLRPHGRCAHRDSGAGPPA